MMEYTVLTESSGGLFANPLFLILFYVVVLGGLWFILMRPQKKEQKRVAAMIADMEVGDTVLTTSGFYGVVIDITEEDVIVEFGNNKKLSYPDAEGSHYASRKARCRRCQIGMRQHKNEGADSAFCGVCFSYFLGNCVPMR